MGARVIGPELAKAVADAFLAQTFDEDGRSAGNVKAIEEVDAKYGVARISRRSTSGLAAKRRWWRLVGQLREEVASPLWAHVQKAPDRIDEIPGAVMLAGFLRLVEHLASPEVADGAVGVLAVRPSSCRGARGPFRPHLRPELRGVAEVVMRNLLPAVDSSFRLRQPRLRARLQVGTIGDLATT